MPSSTFSFPSPDDTQITAYRWDAAGEPRAAVQLTHGMGEHARRPVPGSALQAFRETSMPDIMSDMMLGMVTS